MTLPTQSDTEMRAIAPVIYYGGDSGYLLTCIAKGTDDCLYWVVVENGGWLWRTLLDEQVDEAGLRPFPLELSRDIARLIWGNVGVVKIAVSERYVAESAPAVSGI